MKRNYVPGESEVVSQVAAGSITVNAEQYLVIDGYYKFLIADIQLYYGASKDLVPVTDYQLIIDQKYTEIESGYSGKQIIAQVKITNAAYDGENLYVTGLNFGTYTDNEATVKYVDDSGVLQDLQSVTDNGSTTTNSIYINESGSGELPKLRVTSLLGTYCTELGVDPQLPYLRMGDPDDTDPTRFGTISYNIASQKFLVGDFPGVGGQDIVMSYNSGVTFDSENDIPNIKYVDEKKALWKGYVDPAGMSIDLLSSPTTRTFSLTHTSGTVKFRSSGKEFSYSNGASELEFTLPAVEGIYFPYFNDSGVIAWETISQSDAVSLNNALIPILTIDQNGAGSTWQEISSVSRWEDVRANEIENHASALTKSNISTGQDVGFVSQLDASTIGVTSGRYFTARDFSFTVDAEDQSTKTWAVFYLEGKDGLGQDKIMRKLNLGNGIPYYSDGSSLKYNINTAGTFSVGDVANGNYVACHLLVANGQLGKITSAIGQAQYSNLNTARDSLETEKNNIRGYSQLFGVVSIIGSCIFKNNNGVGELQYVDAKNNLFRLYQPSSGSAVSGGTDSQNLQDVLSQAPEGDAGGKPIFNLPAPTVDTGAVRKVDLDNAVDGVMTLADTQEVTGNKTFSGLVDFTNAIDVQNNDGTVYTRIEENKIVGSDYHTPSSNNEYTQKKYVDDVADAIVDTVGWVLKYDQALPIGGSTGNANKIVIGINERTNTSYMESAPSGIFKIEGVVGGRTMSAVIAFDTAGDSTTYRFLHNDFAGGQPFVAYVEAQGETTSPYRSAIAVQLQLSPTGNVKVYALSSTNISFTPVILDGWTAQSAMYWNQNLTNGITTTQTAEENITVGDQGLLSVGGAGFWETLSLGDVFAFRPDVTDTGGSTVEYSPALKRVRLTLTYTLSITTSLIGTLKTGYIASSSRYGYVGVNLSDGSMEPIYLSLGTNVNSLAKQMVAGDYRTTIEYSIG